MKQSEPICHFSVRELLSSGDRYVIPMYQRNYAWGESEITQLIQDVLDYAPSNQNYYIGTLVVHERTERSKEQSYETIDGQQRLTTLSLLTAYLKHKQPSELTWYKEQCLEFDSRKHSQATADALFENGCASRAKETLRPDHINEDILNGFELIGKILPQKLKDNESKKEPISRQQFSNYLFEKVQIMRVKVPEDTDLNHYFEIMNNRGEQLEKHEVLKSRLLEVLNKIEDLSEKHRSKDCLHSVWEACANMERYVQMGFKPEERNRLFGSRNWNTFELTDFDAVAAALEEARDQAQEAENLELTFEEIIHSPQASTTDTEVEESPDRFNSVINFANFLTHVLRIETHDDVPLDDKRLIKVFDEFLLLKDNPIQRTKNFIFALLRCKFLYDKYIIKREFIGNSDGWSLKQLKWNEGRNRNQAGRPSYVNTFGETGDEQAGTNRRLLMLLSAFHVSTPTRVYKHWLNGALNYLYAKDDPISGNSYLDHLESLAKAFVFDRFLVEGDGDDYYEIIYNRSGRCHSKSDTYTMESIDGSLRFGEIENNFIFNFLDYLLWLKNQHITKVREFEFTFRSSVEHFYPQHPQPGHPKMAPKSLNTFGNLCLISHSKNSRLSNYQPVAKIEHYAEGPLDSIKQYLMMQQLPWDEKNIWEHDRTMKHILLMSLSETDDA